MITISNGQVTASFQLHGGEMCSLKKGEREYLWNADPTYWNRHSPVLFPFVGKVWQGQYRVQGKPFEMGQHGFARDMDSVLLSQTDNEVWFLIESSEATLLKYPYPFRLKLGYRLHEQSVDVCWHVENTGAEAMLFQIGAHPAFLWPSEAAQPGAVTNDEALLGWFRLSREGQLPKVLRRTMLTAQGYADLEQEQRISMEQAGLLPLTYHLFGKDALVLDDMQVDCVELLAPDQSPYLTVRFDTPLVGLWSPPGKHAPFVCIEPWYGRCDHTEFSGDLSEKDHIYRLAPGAHFEAKYTITIEN